MLRVDTERLYAVECINSHTISDHLGSEQSLSFVLHNLDRLVRVS